MDRRLRDRAARSRDDALKAQTIGSDPMVFGRTAPADESVRPARPERASHMGERPCRIVEEHRPETREQDVETRRLGRLGMLASATPEQDRRILGQARTGR